MSDSATVRAPALLQPHDGTLLQRLFTPLSIAAYVTWLAVCLAVVSPEKLRVGDPATWAGLAALLAFIGLFLACAARDAQGDQRWLPWVVALQGATTVAAESLLHGGQTCVLLIIVAAQLVLMWPLRIFVAYMATLNLAFAVLWFNHGNAWSVVALSLLPVLGFQAFAALTGHYAGSRERAREHLAQVNAELLATRCLLEESARAGERLKLSRELHDVAGHTLTALKLNLARLGRDSTLAAREEVRISTQLADELLSQIRQVVSTLRAHDGLDLRTSLAALTQPVAGVCVSLEIEDALRVDDIEQAEALLRCAQESITNALRHGRARNIAIGLRRHGETIELRIENDGVSPTATVVAGNGLTGMRERLEALGGDLIVTPTPPRGLRIEARIPLHVPAYASRSDAP